MEITITAAIAKLLEALKVALSIVDYTKKEKAKLTEAITSLKKAIIATQHYYNRLNHRFQNTIIYSLGFYLQCHSQTMHRRTLNVDRN